jgi:surfactin synthase thioesterase subunit
MTPAADARRSERKGREMADETAGDAAWTRCFHPVAGAAGTRLACFPHIGGSASFYRQLSAALAPDVEVLAAQYPGRQDRSGEEPLRDIHAIADGAFEALRPSLDERTAFFGHSMGALVAFEVARRMERTLGVSPSALIASGMWAPSRQREGEIVAQDAESMSEVVSALRRLDGTPPALLEDAGLMRGVLGAIKSDYAAVDAYRCSGRARVTCPVTVFVGDSDPHVSVEAAQAWAGHTSGGFALQVFGGGHFYLANLWTAVAHEISEVLQASV